MLPRDKPVPSGVGTVAEGWRRGSDSDDAPGIPDDDRSGGNVLCHNCASSDYGAATDVHAGKDDDSCTDEDVFAHGDLLLYGGMIAEVPAVARHRVVTCEEEATGPHHHMTAQNHITLN